MRGTIAKRIRPEAQGAGKSYRRVRQTGQIILTPGSWRANYQRLKQQFRGKPNVCRV